VLATVPVAGLDAVLVAVELVLESRLSHKKTIAFGYPLHL
jgi:hypothetical protein